MWAASMGHAEVVSMLAKNDADTDAVDQDGATALMKAARRGFLDAVKTLLEEGVSVNAKDEFGWTALMCGKARLR